MSRARLPTIAAANAIAKRDNLDGVLIVGFGEGSYSIASYGRTKRRCDMLANLNDFIVNAIDGKQIDLTGFGEK